MTFLQSVLEYGCLAFYQEFACPSAQKKFTLLVRKTIKEVFNLIPQTSNDKLFQVLCIPTAE